MTGKDAIECCYVSQLGKRILQKIERMSLDQARSLSGVELEL